MRQANSTRSKRPNCLASPSGHSAAGATATKKTAKPEFWTAGLAAYRPSAFRPAGAAEVEALYRTRYKGIAARHFHEYLVRDHQFTWGYTWTKAFLQSKGLLVYS